ncbi:probable U6 snRNA-associated Sm-like protein LSm4 [Oncorhynchus masou masou]|uniref:probable U6 snRNA-associated Sm-like protein LSm4 n=1 Tax=Oncorhynchus masou masou TaxID=90313 RepID=UPI003183DB31
MKRARQCLLPLRRLKRCGMSTVILKTFCTIESILTNCITAWYGKCNALNCKTLQRMVPSTSLGPSSQDLYIRRCQTKAIEFPKTPATQTIWQYVQPASQPLTTCNYASPGYRGRGSGTGIGDRDRGRGSGTGIGDWDRGRGSGTGIGDGDRGRGSGRGSGTGTGIGDGDRLTGIGDGDRGRGSGTGIGDRDRGQGSSDGDRGRGC